MQFKAISKITIKCEGCGTTISCNPNVQNGDSFICPGCNNELNARFENARMTALKYNKVIAELQESQAANKVEYGDV